MPVLKIENKTGCLHDTKVFIDGVEIKRLVSIKMDIDVNSDMTATAVFRVDALDVESKVMKGMETAYLFGEKKDAP